MLPSCVLVTLLARLYLRYRKLSLLQGVLTSLRPAVVAMIASAGVSILVTAFWDEAVTFAGDLTHDAMIVSAKQPDFKNRGVSFELLLGKVTDLL